MPGSTTDQKTESSTTKKLNDLLSATSTAEKKLTQSPNDEKAQHTYFYAANQLVLFYVKTLDTDKALEIWETLNKKISEDNLSTDQKTTLALTQSLVEASLM